MRSVAQLRADGHILIDLEMKGVQHVNGASPSATAALRPADVSVHLEEVTDAYRALGQLLAQHRQAAGLTQAGLAGLVPWSRSTVASVELGQAAGVEFWDDCDKALGTGGALLADARRAIELGRRYRAAAKAAAKRTGQDAGGVAQPGRQPRSSAVESVDADPLGRPSVLDLVLPAGASVTIAFDGAGLAGQSWRVVVTPADLVYGVDQMPMVTDGARLYSIEEQRERRMRRRGRP